MKKKSFSKKMIAAMIAVVMAIISLSAVSAAPLLDGTAKGSVKLNCNKPGYEFAVYKVASLDSTTSNPYETSYKSFVPAATNAINSGVTADIIAALDTVDPMPSTAKVVGTFASSATSTTTTINNLEQGIYYVRATNYPAGVKSVTNSVFSLPYYDGDTWVYTVDDIELAAKVSDDVPTTEKSITNSTKGNVNYTDVSLGDTINFSLKSTTAGSASMKLNSYTVYDDMSAGLTLNKNSFKVSLLKPDGTKIKDLAAADFKVTVTKEKAGENTEFNVALTKDFLQKDDFYASDVYYTDVTYSAVLNKYAIVGVQGNPNTEGKLEYSNKNDVKAEVEGNTVYVYTYAAKTNKTDLNGSPLENAEFSLFRTESEANSLTNVLATGKSDKNGLVKYYNAQGEEMRLASGTYFVVETSAPAGFNLYGKVIKLVIEATYGDTFVNGTYVTNSPKDGYASVNVADSPIIMPKTGGEGTGFLYLIGGILLAASAMTVSYIIYLKRKQKKGN